MTIDDIILGEPTRVLSILGEERPDMSDDAVKVAAYLLSIRDIPPVPGTHQDVYDSHLMEIVHLLEVYAPDDVVDGIQALLCAQ